MYSIGKFSKITGVSTKTLIWYDNVGLLKPEYVNPENGYRFYGDKNLKDIIDIYFFQSMDFSVKEISALSQDVIDNKIKALENKINLIRFNIDLLKNLKEENMKNNKLSIFELSEKLVNGKWRYKTTSNNFNSVLYFFPDEKQDKLMPKFLFFGENNVGTDLNDFFGYSHDTISIYDKKRHLRYFWFFVLDGADKLVLYEKPEDPNKRIKFHIYQRYTTDKPYTSQDIKTIYEKYKPVFDRKLCSFNQNLIGYWEVYDEIKEDQVEEYNGTKKEKNPGFILSPLFDILDIKEDKSVKVMVDDESLELKNGDIVKTFTPENSVMTISMGNHENEFYINNHLIKEKHKGVYRKIKNKEYLFVNLSNNPDLVDELLVFKKRR